MGTVDVDVITKGGPKDLAVRAFHKELKDQAGRTPNDNRILIYEVVSVFDMVDRILKSIGPRRIKRLRVFGHGSEGIVQMGPFVYTGRRVIDLSGRPRIDQSDLVKVIMVVQSETRSQTGVTITTEYKLINEAYLRKLVGKFDKSGWVELHSCRVVDKSGRELIKALARLWGVQVHASDAKQYVGGGLEGRILVAAPSGIVREAVSR